MLYPAIFGLAVSPAGGAAVILTNLAERLSRPHALRPPPASLTTEELDAVSYESIDMLNAIPREATHKGYAVIGGSGYVGTYIVKLLLLRGETSVRILDVATPSRELLDNPAVTFIPCDITSRQSIEEGLTTPFTSMGSPPSVIFHCAASIRFWERAGYTWSASHRVNVQGTENVLTAAHQLPKDTVLIYTSSSDVILPRPRFLHIAGELDTPPYDSVVFSDSDPPLPEYAESATSYVRSKVIGERLVLEANGELLKTLSIRPGQTIVGPADRFLTSTLTMPTVPIWDAEWAHTNVCVWDVAAAHLRAEDALDKRGDEVGGEAFLITGPGPAWTMQDTRNALQHYSTKILVFKFISPLLIWFLAHIVEAFLFLRYYLLLPFFALVGSRPSITPKWAGELIYLQPSTLEYMRDVVIDDSRAREMLGYCPQWTTEQAIRYTVDQVESGAVGGSHGLQLKEL
ncbi:NAD(P)-binding protein [Peniophora sp. CONT]|nr:NAD(P)-binding protein [Peniophora sp. CONT]